MQTTKKYYESGFSREMNRNKHNLKINERLKEARNRKKLSAARVVKELAKQGVSMGHSTLQGYEADENSLNHRYPSVPVLMDLANFYGCSIDYLFGLSDKYKPQKFSKKETDILDVLESKNPVTYNGVKLSRKQREQLVTQLNRALNRAL